MKIQRTIHSTFTQVVERGLDPIALVGDGRPMTYGELARRSDGVARYLQRHGVARGDRVGLYTQRSSDAIAAMLGILKAGAAYVPFDPSYPAKLLEFIHTDCRPALVLADTALDAGTRPAFAEGTVHDIRSAFDAPGQNTALLPEVGPEDAAYIMYTSGSTGHPKGVLIPHRGVVRLAIDNPFADMGPEQVHLQLAPLAFDASTFEIWGALLNGGKLAILSAPFPSLDDVAHSIKRHGVTTLWLTAGLFHLMVDHRLDGLAPLRQLIAGGDVLSPTHIAKAQRGLPSCQLINGYGPTENTTFTCCYRIPREAAPGPIPIGTAIAHTTVHVLDEAWRPVADGDEGELFAGGAGVALGYWNRPDLTAERFVPDLDAGGGATLYRTGDRVRRRPDGNLEFLGRVDRQVKINGKRVELDEIEAALRRSPLVEDAAVTCPPGEAGTRRVHAYVTLRGDHAGAAPGATDDLRSFIKQELPDYMLPATFTVMDTLPLSPTGKIDRAKLPLPAAAEPGEGAPGAAPGAPGSAIEATLMTIWCRILGRKSVGLNDNFFDLGGTSLQLIAVHATITSVMKSDVTVVDLFQYPRISALAVRLARGSVNGPENGGVTAGAILTAEERARRQRQALARARAAPRSAR
jgi:amino acid adenylation domain-containing protein